MMLIVCFFVLFCVWLVLVGVVASQGKMKLCDRANERTRQPGMKVTVRSTTTVIEKACEIDRPHKIC